MHKLKKRNRPCKTTNCSKCATPFPQVWYQTAGEEWRRVLWLRQSCVNICSSWTTRLVKADKCFICVSRQPQRVFCLERAPPQPPPPDLYVCMYLRWKRPGLLMLPLFAFRDLITFESQKLHCVFKFNCLSNFLGKVQRQVDYALFYLIITLKKNALLKSNFKRFHSWNLGEKKEKKEVEDEFVCRRFVEGWWGPDSEANLLNILGIK